jgi:hypothetical protein
MPIRQTHLLVDLPEVKKQIRRKFGGGVFSNDGN